MTIIAVAHGLVVADQMRDGKDGLFTQAGKVYTYAKPIQMWSKREHFKDYFYGFSGSGECQIIQHAGEMAKIGCLDLWFDRYMHVDEMRMLNDSTSFSILLFGLDGTVLMEAVSGHLSMRYLPYKEYAHVAVGSGATAFRKLFTESDWAMCPVRALYGVMAMEPTCGGEVEVWALPTQRNDRLRPLRTHPALSTLEIFKIASQPKKLHYKPESQKWLTSLILRSAKSSVPASRTSTSQKLPASPECQYATLSKQPQVPTSPASRKSPASPAP